LNKKEKVELYILYMNKEDAKSNPDGKPSTCIGVDLQKNHLQIAVIGKDGQILHNSINNDE